MRASTLIVGILFLLLVGFLILSLFAPPVVEGISAYIGEQKAGHAIIPDEVREKWDREGWPTKQKQP